MEDKNEEYLAQIAELRAENAALHGEVDSLQTSFQTLCTTLNEVVRLVSQMNGDVRDNTHNNTVLYNRLCNLPYEILDKRFAEKYEIPRIMTLEETIDEIVLHKKSIARFGDGEFGIMFGVSRWRFQREDEKLAERLREVIASNEENLLIGLNDFYGDLSHRTEADADGIRAYIVKARAQHMELLQKGRLYAHACISRTGSLEKVQNQKRIWEGRDCVFVEGDKTRMGVGNDLFDNAKSIQMAQNEMKIISGQQPILCKAKKSVANFKVREGMPIGLKVTLRGQMMNDFFDKFVSIALPRVRDFRGVPADSFDGKGNYCMGVKEQLIFPEIQYDQVEKIRGMDICFVTTAKTDEEARELLRAMGMPFKK